jgi:hypothetical protein
MPGSGNQIHFENLEALCDYLATQMQSAEGKGGLIDGSQKSKNSE